MLQEYDNERLSTAAPDEIGDALERGEIVKFMPCPIELPTAEVLEALRTDLPKQLKARKKSTKH